MQKAAKVTIAALVVCGVVVLVIIGSSVGKEANWRASKEKGQSAYSKGNFVEARDEYRKAAKISYKAFGKEDPRFIETLRRLAWVCNSMEKYNAGRALFEYIYKLSPETLNRVRMAQTSLAFLNLTDEILDDGTLKGPERGLRIACETLEKHLGSNDTELIPLLNQLGRIYEAEKKYPEAETQDRQILSIAQETQGNISAGAAHAHAVLGGFLDRSADSMVSGESAAERDLRRNELLTKSRTEYTESISTYKTVLGPKTPEIAEVEQLLAQVGKPKPVHKKARSR